MEVYDRGEIVDVDVDLPYPTDVVDKDVPLLKVQSGSKIHNLLNFALPTMKEKSQLVIVGSGPAISKVITVAEMLKRRERGLDQWNKIAYKRTLEYWEPKEEGMSRIQVNRDVPVMHILLSKTSLDGSLPGVQKYDAKEARHQEQRKTRKPNQGEASSMRNQQRNSLSTASRNEKSTVEPIQSGSGPSNPRHPNSQNKRGAEKDVNSNRAAGPSSKNASAKNRPRERIQRHNCKQLGKAAGRGSDQGNQGTPATGDLKSNDGGSSSEAHAGRKMDPDES